MKMTKFYKFIKDLPKKISIPIKIITRIRISSKIIKMSIKCKKTKMSKIHLKRIKILFNKKRKVSNNNHNNNQNNNNSNNNMAVKKRILTVLVDWTFIVNRMSRGLNLVIYFKNNLRNLAIVFLLSLVNLLKILLKIIVNRMERPLHLLLPNKITIVYNKNNKIKVLAT